MLATSNHPSTTKQEHNSQAEEHHRQKQNHFLRSQKYHVLIFPNLKGLRSLWPTLGFWCLSGQHRSEYILLVTIFFWLHQIYSLRASRFSPWNQLILSTLTTVIFNLWTMQVTYIKNSYYTWIVPSTELIEQPKVTVQHLASALITSTFNLRNNSWASCNWTVHYYF